MSASEEAGGRPEPTPAKEPERSWLYAERRPQRWFGGGDDGDEPFAVLAFALPAVVLDAILFLWVSEIAAVTLLVLVLLAAIVRGLIDWG